MVAGLNLKVDIYRIEHPIDDPSGGAVPSGTLLYDEVEASLHPVEPEMLLIQQGIELDYWYKLMIRPSTLTVREKDEVEIAKPVNHPEYGTRFIVRAVFRSPEHPDDSRSHIVLTCSKRKYANYR